MRELFKKLYQTGDFWGGIAAMLVALPASIAFGVTVYSAISPGHAPLGALAGIIGAIVIGSLAAVLGGTDRLISAPCAPAAALLSAFAIEMAVSMSHAHFMDMFSTISRGTPVTMMTEYFRRIRARTWISHWSGMVLSRPRARIPSMIL